MSSRISFIFSRKSDVSKGVEVEGDNVELGALEVAGSMLVDGGVAKEVHGGDDKGDEEEELVELVGSSIISAVDVVGGVEVEDAVVDEVVVEDSVIGRRRGRGS